MKRAGFTMIELIFVIVILGILASVAVPKLLGVKNSAEEGLVKSFVGGLNTTVGPAKWSQSLMDGKNGSIKNASYKITAADTDIPTGVVMPSGGFDTSKCVASTALPKIISTAATKAGEFNIFCVDGSASTAPKFYYGAFGLTLAAGQFATADTAKTNKIK